jgi:hypothetical protein
VNAEGLRSTFDVPYKKPDGHYRILALGDSFTEGEGVNDDENFCFLLNGLLNNDPDSDVTYDVLDAGVESYAPILEYLYLKEKGIKFNPDLVVMFYDMSDLMQTPEYLANAEFDSNGNVIRVKPDEYSLASQLDVLLKSRFYFLALLYKSARHAILGDKADEGEALGQATDKLLAYTLSADQTPWKKEWDRIFYDIEATSNFCKEHHVKFAVVIYPWGHQVNNIEWEYGRAGFGVPNDYTAPPDVADMMVSELNSRGITTLNLFPAFRDHKGSDLLYFHQDMHWRKKGHAFVAPYISEFLKPLIAQ